MLWLLPLIILLLPSYMVRFSIGPIPTTLLEVLIYLSFLILLIVQPLAVTGERLKSVLKTYGWPVGLILVGSIWATIIAPDQRVGLGILKGYILDPMLLALMIIAFVDSWPKYYRALSALLATGFVVGLTALLGPQTPDGRALGVFNFDVNPSPNYLALLLTPIAGLAVGLLAQPRVRYRLYLAAAYVAMVVGILAAESRSGLFSLGFGTGLALIWQLTARWPIAKQSAGRWLIAGFIIGSLLIGSWLAKPNFSVDATSRQTTSNNLRYEIWRKTVVDIIPNAPIVGVGLGNFQNYFTDATKHLVNFPDYIAPWARTPHNFVLNLWVNLGLVGLIGFAWLIFQLLIDWLKQRTNRRLAIAFVVSLVTLLIQGLVDTPYWKNDLSALFWIIITLGYLSGQLKKEGYA